MLIFIVAMAYFMEWLDASALNTALPQIAHGFHVNPVDLKEALTAYLLSVGVFIPVSGYVCDRFGIKPSFFVAIVIFMLGSIGCSFSVSVPMLVGFRIMQGVGGALLTPVGRMVLLRAFGAKEFAVVISKVAMVSALAMMLGPVFGGALSAYVDWRWIFWLNIPFCCLALVMVSCAMPDFSRPLHLKPFDWFGFVVIAASLALCLFTVDMLTSDELSFGLKLFCIGLSGLGFYIFVRHLQRSDKPLLQPDMFRYRRFSWMTVCSFVVRLGIASPPFLIPLLLQSGYHYNAFVSGLMILPIAIAIGGTKQFARPFMRYLGEKKSVYTITVFNALVLACYYFVIQGQPLIGLLLVLNFCVGAGFSVQAVVMNSLIYTAVPDKFHSNAVPINSAVIQLSTSFAVALAALVLIAMMSGRSDLSHHIPLMAFKVVFIVEALFPVLALIAIRKSRL